MLTQFIDVYAYNNKKGIKGEKSKRNSLLIILNYLLYITVMFLQKK